MSKGKNAQAAPILAVSVFFVLVAIAGWLILVSPQQAHAKKLGATIQSVNSEVNRRELAVHVRTAQTTQIRTADLFRLTKAMPDQTDMPDILLELSRVARGTGISFDSLTPEAPTVLSGYQVVPIDVVFQGNYYDLADFVYRLRNLVVVHHGDLIATGRLFSIGSIDFAEGQNKFPQIQATLVVDAFVYGSTLPVLPAPGVSATDTSSTATTSTGTTESTTTSTGTTPSPTTPPLPPVSANAAGATN